MQRHHSKGQSVGNDTKGRHACVEQSIDNDVRQRHSVSRSSNRFESATKLSTDLRAELDTKKSDLDTE